MTHLALMGYRSRRKSRNKSGIDKEKQQKSAFRCPKSIKTNHQGKEKDKRKPSYYKSISVFSHSSQLVSLR